MSVDGDILLSAIRPVGDIGLVFEAADGTGYLYLWAPNEAEDRQIKSYIHLWSGPNPVTGDRLALTISKDDRFGGLLIDGQLWAAFNLDTFDKFGGNYRAGHEPCLPDVLREALRALH